MNILIKTIRTEPVNKKIENNPCSSKEATNINNPIKNNDIGVLILKSKIENNNSIYFLIKTFTSLQ